MGIRHGHPRQGAARLVLALGLAVFAGATAGMALRLEPFHTWYFLFAWWPFIAVGEASLLLMGGYAEPFERPGRFAALCAASTLLWLAYEVLNFRLGNWHYIGVPRETALRWTAYAASFATVLPGLSVARRLIEFTGLWEDARCKPWTRAARNGPALVATGLICLALSMLWPQWFFALVWAPAPLLLEPWLRARGGRSLLRDLALGRPRHVYTTLLAGLVCGGLWECWNFWAGAKWFYTVPLVGNLKLFEMPVLGFIGFPPFALGCYGAASTLDLALERLAKLPTPTRTLAWTLAIACAATFATWAMQGLDSHTVTAFR